MPKSIECPACKCDVRLPKQKRFMVFAYPDYYPNGGINDLVNIYETFGDARNAANKVSTVHNYVDIYDIETGITTKIRS